MDTYVKLTDILSVSFVAWPRKCIVRAMNKTSYKSLLDSRYKYDSMLKFLGIKQKNNRWIEAYKLVHELENARSAGSIEAIDGEVLGRMRFALVDLNNLEVILDQFRNEGSQVFKEKFQSMLGGSNNPMDETSVASRARDAQFELFMCARFREVGLAARLGQVHPDILVTVNGHEYGFECKRIFNFNQGAVQKNIEKAIAQLVNHFLDDDYSKRGLPLLCIDRYITGGDKIMLAHDEAAARGELDRQIEIFVSNHYKRWNAAKAKDGRVLGVLIFMNITAIFDVEGIPVVCHQVGVSNNGWAGWSKVMFDEFVAEIASLMGPMSHSKL